MSAFICNLSHIDVLVQPNRRSYAYFHAGELHEDKTRSEIGQILHDENVRSVNHRYGSTVKPDVYKFRHPARRYSAVEVLKAVSCLDYQSCETRDWPETAAYKILQDIKSMAINKLPGYDAAAWEIPETNRREKRPRSLRQEPRKW